MFGLEMLDVLIGLATVYLVFGIACTAAVEAIASWFSVRSKNLEAALTEFLAGEQALGQSFVDAFYAHPMIQALSKGEQGRPSYIPGPIVAHVVQSLLITGNAINSADSFNSLRAAVEALPGDKQSNRIKGLLDTLVTQVSEDVVEFRQAVEAQFNAAMDRATGWFKRYTQNVALAVATVFVVGANVDTMAIASALAADPEARAKMVEVAAQQLKTADVLSQQAKVNNDAGGVQAAKEQTEAAKNTLARAADQMESTGLRFGWAALPSSVGDWFSKLAGLLVSIVAISLGAPFWFSILQRFMQVRAAGVAPEEKK
ncbi:MAG TPA: hypothetical protein VM553_05225 [Dongiaceae bacterium]|nr:hypothetical protein [Dongiaceae bacterium]